MYWGLMFASKLWQLKSASVPLHGCTTQFPFNGNLDGTALSKGKAGMLREQHVRTLLSRLL